ncbi:MAG: NAD+ synthase, partial [Oceanospirillaceae bacterium]|nr:NAD+ synthase [Oceanospirillaceae bacterium]
MSQKLVVALAQINFLVGDIPGNTQRVIDCANDLAAQGGTDLVLFSELALTGYPPEDLLLRPSLERRISDALARIQTEVRGICVVVGYPKKHKGALRNMAGVIVDGQLVYEYAKQKLPNYQVFDEKRYFEPADEVGVF